MATRIKRRAAGRAQYLSFAYNGTSVMAARYQLTSDRYSPWLITTGEHSLPTSAIARGRLLSKLYNQAA